MAQTRADARTPVVRARARALILGVLGVLTLAWPAVAAGASDDTGLAAIETGAQPPDVPSPPAPSDPGTGADTPPPPDAPATEVGQPPDAPTTEVGQPPDMAPEASSSPPTEVAPPVVEEPAEAVGSPPEPVVAPAPAAPAVLDVTPESSSSLTGSDHLLTAAVTDAAGNAVAGAAVDFEIVAGPADDDVGTPGDTPLSPDLGCITTGGGPGVPATCTVAYAERANDAGTDRVLAWIDHDGDDATVEADVGEARNSTMCVADHPGETPEPDGTDCVVQEWLRRVPTAVAVSTDFAANVPGVEQRLDAVVTDQAGKVLAGDERTPVRFYFRAGSAHRPPAPKPLGRPDLSCRTDTAGSCTVTYPGTVRGVDTVCAVIPGGGNECDEPADAPPADNKADVVEVAWVGGLLDVDERASSSLAGTQHVLTARVVDGAGAALTGVEVDFEVVSGPGDDDVGGDGAGPRSPDLTCVTGTDADDAGACRVAYTEVGNLDGVDAILAWVDADRDDATVEAERGSGAGGGGSGCALDGSELGSIDVPDDIACVTHSWSARVPTFVDVSPEVATRGPGDTHRLDVVVLDQGGTAIGAPTEVRFAFLPGSASDAQGLACTTSGGACSVRWSGPTSGIDTVCAALPDAVSGCGEPAGAPERTDGADVVSVWWTSTGEPDDGASGDGASGDGTDAAFGAGRGRAANQGDDARAQPGPGSAADASGSVPERFGRELAQQAPFPVALLVAIVLYLWVQNRIDRKDPKLTAALEEETLPFQ